MASISPYKTRYNLKPILQSKLQLNILGNDNFEHIREWSAWLTNKDRSLERTREWISQNSTRFANNESFTVGIWYKDAPAGQIDFAHINWNARKFEIGCGLGASFQGKGLVAKFCCALIDHAIHELQFNRVEMRDAVRMWRDSKEEAIRQKDIHSFNEHLSFLQSVLIKENKVYLAIDKESDTVAGLLAISGSRLNQLYIHINYQKMGIGSRLLDMAKELSPGKLELFTFEVNKKARTFYEKYGFKITGRNFENEENLPDIKYEWVKNNGV